MAEAWDQFEWDDENRKNGNVQHLRDHGIEPNEAEECFFHDYLYARDDREFDDIYVLDGRTDRGRRLRIVFQDKGHGLGTETAEEGKTMKKKLGRLPKAERERVEARYQRMKPKEFDSIMSSAKEHTPAAIRLPGELIRNLKRVAESEGEPEYQAMVRRWIEERLRRETSIRN